MTPEITPDLQAVLQQQHGGPVQVAGADASYVVMSMDVYRTMIGVGTDEAFAASVQALQAANQAVQQGRTRPLVDALDELGRKYEVPG